MTTQQAHGYPHITDMTSSILRRFQSQHLKDLQTYRRAHQEWRNRFVHYAMIPVACFSFQLAVRLVTGNVVSTLLAWILASLSLLVATQLRLGVAVFLFHISSGGLANSITHHCNTTTTISTALASWTMAWGVQVGLGHYILERNSPNVSNMMEVSYLAMCLSTLIAWSS